MNTKELERTVDAARGIEIAANAYIKKSAYIGYVPFEVNLKDALIRLMKPLAAAIVVVTIAAVVDIWRRL